VTDLGIGRNLTVLSELSGANCSSGENIRYDAKLRCQISKQVSDTWISLSSLGKLRESETWEYASVV